MVLTERERNIAIGLGGLIAVAVLWFFIIGPYVSALREVASAIDAARTEQTRGLASIKMRNDLAPEWKVIQTSMSANTGDAKQEVRDELNQWAAACGLNQKQLIDGQIGHEKDFDVINFTFSGQGSQKAVASYIYLCETTPRLLRITKITLKPAKEGLDDLNFDLNVSTICRRAETGPRQRIASYSMQRGDSL